MEDKVVKQQFILDKRLAADTMPVVSLALCDVRLMKDKRWPWVVLVPRVMGAEEIHHLSADDQLSLLAEMNEVALALEAITGCEKVNIAALGNIVRQLHVHIIARNIGDENWPGPVWGFGKPQAYGDEVAQKLIKSLQLKLD